MSTPRDSNEVRFELTSTEMKWLEKQSGFCREAMVEILTGALQEWIARNPDIFITQETITAILHEALDEFISRHKVEFL
jgi:hypothetical protein